MLLLQSRCWSSGQRAPSPPAGYGELTIIDWGWVVRTWIMAPAFLSSLTIWASSEATLEIFETKLAWHILPPMAMCSCLRVRSRPIVLAARFSSP